MSLMSGRSFLASEVSNDFKNDGRADSHRECNDERLRMVVLESSPANEAEHGGIRCPYARGNCRPLHEPLGGLTCNATCESDDGASTGDKACSDE